MTEASEKLELFSKTVFKETSEKVSKMIREAEKIRDDRILGASDRFLAMATTRIEDEKRAIEQKYVRLRASEKLQANKELLALRESLIEKLFDNVKKRLSEYTEKDEYAGKLESICLSIANEHEGKTGEICLSRKDYELSEKILSKLPAGYTAVADKSIKLGGVKVIFEKDNIMCDMTYDCALEEARESFCLEEKLRLEAV